MEAAKNATVAKARAIYGNRLKAEQYRELVSKKSVAEVAEYLQKNTHYGSALANINTMTVHRGLLETILRRYSFERYEKLCKFQQLRKESFYNYLIVLSEIREILSAIMYLNAKSSEEYISALPAYLLSRASFDLIELAKTRSFADILRVIRNTPYYDVLAEVKADEAGKVDFTLCEVMLRSYYLKWLLEVADKDFKGRARSMLKQQIEMQVDLINVINSYRLKTYFGASSEEIHRNMLPAKGRMPKRVQDELWDTESGEEFLQLFSKTLYGRQLEGFGNDEFELRITKLRYSVAKRTLMFSENAAVSLYSLIFLFEVELSNIINIIEGIRYNKSAAYLEAMLVYS